MAGHVSGWTDLRGHVNRNFLIKKALNWLMGGVKWPAQEIKKRGGCANGELLD